MEYVDGLPITQIAIDTASTPKNVWSCSSPSAWPGSNAHQKGVFHRDINPSNVMVTQVDERATPKVIDFGIARATEQQPGKKLVLTQLAQFIATPEYMSPEQADLVRATSMPAQTSILSASCCMNC
ncbi:MAG TPA: AarF/UbiB family protein [Bryobacteraceae bacterium]|nr:AarF/UbiB family protein [Bryobacteraceae bacterium]